MLNFFKKKAAEPTKINPGFELELVASVLAFEVARSDGDISETELHLLLNNIKEISLKVGKNEQEILKIIEIYSSDSVSFHEFIEDINKDFCREEKLSLIGLLWDVAYADNVLAVDEERLIRRIADLIRLKNIEVLRLKDKAKNKI